MKIEEWFVGIVEEVDDPLLAGRVRVRCLSYHTPNRKLLPTENLLWAQCIFPVSNAGVGGVGAFENGLLPGSMVFGFFRDGSDMQDPVVMGAFNGAAVGSNIAYANDYGYGATDDGVNIGGYSFPDESNTIRSLDGISTQYGTFLSDLLSGVQGSTLPLGSSFEAPKVPIILPADTIDKLIKTVSAEEAAGISEDPGAQNKGGVRKYWAGKKTCGWDGSNTSGKGAPYCAVFVSWCIEKAEILNDKNDLPYTASVSQIIRWARRKDFMVVRTKPRTVKKGDLVTVVGRSHIGIAITDSDEQGKYTSIDGNGPSHKIAKRNRTCKGTKHAMSFIIDGSQPEPGPAINTTVQIISNIA